MAKNQELVELIRTIKFRSKMNQSAIAAKIGVSKQYLSDTINGRFPFSEDLKQKLYEQFTYLNEEPSPSPVIETDSASGIPYYSEMPVSAGSADLQLMDGDERAVGYIRIAGVSGKCAFPVVGCSMEPVIHAGDIVVVDVLDRYELIDPDKIYMIVTADDRMIKHIEMDESNPDILWCVSPNYRRFSILKTDIRQIFKVTFYGRFV